MSSEFKAIKKHTIRNEEGTMAVTVLNLGAIVASVLVTNSAGEQIETVLNYKDLELYRQNDSYFGAVVGPTSGRIENASFQIKGSRYALEVNDGTNNLHGGAAGLSKAFWSRKEHGESRLVLAVDCGHLEGGYPGNIHCEVEYKIVETTLEINYLVNTDRETYIDLTNHTYFNLEGDSKHTVYAHELELNCETYCCVDASNLPVEICKVSENQDFDFRKPRRIKGADKPFVGIDHPFLINEGKDFVSKLRSNESGLELVVSTDCPVVVIYTGNHLEVAHSGICFETQELPNNVNSGLLPVKITTEDQPFRRFTKFSFNIL